MRKRRRAARRNCGNATPKRAPRWSLSLSHDLKTPLTALTVATANLGLDTLTAAERSEQIRIVQGELARLKRLFDNVVDMASVETRAVSAEVEWVQASDILEAARLRATPGARRAGG